MQIEYYITITAGLILGLLAGFVMHRSDFCVAGMIRDMFLFKNFKKIKSLIVLVIVSMMLFEIARLLGLLSHYPFAILGSPSWANLVGGFFFGIGMTLAGGCVVGVLYKMGSGSVLSLIALVSILIGSALYAEIHDSWVAFIKATTFTKETLLTSLLGITPSILVLICGAIGFAYIYRWYCKGVFKVAYAPAGYINHAKAGVIIAFIGLASYLIVGMPLGITTSYAKIAGFFEKALIPEHFDTLKYFKVTSLDYRFTLTGNRMTGGPAPVFDAIAAIQIPVIVGIVFGSFYSALTLKEFKIHFKLPVMQYLSAFIGGILLGISSRLAQGCNIWHIFGGLPIFALQSMLFCIGILPGVWLGTKILTRYVIK